MALLLAAASAAPALQAQNPPGDPPGEDPAAPPPEEQQPEDDSPGEPPAQPLPEPSAEPASPPDPIAGEALLAATDAKDARRLAAELLEAGRESRLPHDARRALTAALREGGPPAQGVVAAIAARQIAPSGLWPYLHARIADADPHDLPPLLAAAASFRTPAAAFVLVEHLDSAWPAPVRSAAAEALARLSGRSDLGEDAMAWRTWLATGLTLSEHGWNRRLIEGLAHRLASLQHESRLASRRLVSTYRQLWLRTPAEGRAAFLADLLRDELASLRQLGLDLVRQELAAGNPLGGAVADAAAGLLRSEDARRRLDGAVLLDQIAPPEGGRLVLEALAEEENPAVAARLLEASARWPDLAVRDHALRWLERDRRTSNAAAEALVALHREGLLEVEDDRTQIVEALRFVPPEHINAAAARLLVELGEPSDVARMASFLSADDPSLRLHAANALARRPDTVDRLLDAAGRDPELFPAAVRAIREHRLSPEGIARLGTVSSIDPRERAQAQHELAAELPTPELVELAELVEDPVFAESLLEIAAEPGRRPAEDASEADIEAWRDAMRELARARVARGSFEDALEVLDALDEGPAGDDGQRVADLRTRALLGLERIEEAGEAGGSVEAWLAHLEGQRRAGRISEEALAAVEDLFGDEFTDRQRERLESLGPSTRVTDADDAPSAGDG